LHRFKTQTENRCSWNFEEVQGEGKITGEVHVGENLGGVQKNGGKRVERKR
jgi:hypothetical protein